MNVNKFQGEELYRDFVKLLTSQTVIEYDILPLSYEASNGVPFVYENQRLGINKWCAKMLYVHAYRCFQAYKTGGSVVAAPENASYSDESSLIHVTQCVLMFHADHMTAWNSRKALARRRLLPLDIDLKFTVLVLQKHPKSSETFIHRRWLLKQSFSYHSVALSEYLKAEISLSQTAASGYANNYYAWSHRIWALEHFADTVTEETLLEELKSVSHFINHHISEYCGFHYKHFVISRLYEYQPTRKTDELIHSELKENEAAIEFYPEHESLWMFRRSMIALYLNKNLEKSDSTSKQISDISEPSQLTNGSNLLSEECQYARKVLDSSRGDWQRTLCNRYLRWLRAQGASDTE